MKTDEFRKIGHELVDWIAEYYDTIEDFPVMSKVQPKEIYSILPASPPNKPESFEQIFQDFNDIIMPGITHWQHPKFFGYFPANTSLPSILGEMLTSALAAQCMVWQTSPAAAELEERVMEWLAEMLGLPFEFSGVIQDTASTSTLCSILTAREKKTDYNSNTNGIDSNNYRVYCSEEAHSSVDKAVKIAGIGSNNLVKIPVDENFAMKPKELEKKIKEDIENGKIPLCIVAAIGTTGSVAVDPLKSIGKIAEKYKIWLHVDAAFAGTALLLPEHRKMIDGIEKADTFVFNPHKWMFTNFDCSAYFVKDKTALIRTFEIMPEYLKTGVDSKVNNYRDWGIQLGRRFRALKLWFVIRSFGVFGLQEKIRKQIRIAQKLAEKIKNNPDFEILAPANLNVICFRYKPANINDNEELNLLNEDILKHINQTGKMFISHTKLKGIYTIRFVVAQTNVEERHINEAWAQILETCELVNIFS